MAGFMQVAKMTHLTFLTLTGDGNGGTNKMPSLNKLTLQHIRVLANLRTLTLVCFKEPDLDLQWLQPLRSLVLGARHTHLCDLTTCTQLTSLAITWDLHRPRDIGMRKPRRLLLPTGSSVQLQQLSVSAVYKCGENLEELKNLQDATQLTSMQFLDLFPRNLDEGDWPLSMPHLNTFKADLMPDWPPKQLLNYSQLRHLDIHLEHRASCLPAMPAWFSQLTHLVPLGHSFAVQDSPQFALY